MELFGSSGLALTRMVSSSARRLFSPSPMGEEYAFLNEKTNRAPSPDGHAMGPRCARDLAGMLWQDAHR
jgi:hypothetical protein